MSRNGSRTVLRGLGRSNAPWLPDFLMNLRRGILDVPPRAWEIDCENNPACSSIVSDVTFLFENMSRIGVDTPSNGDGILIWDPELEWNNGEYATQWFLPTDDHIYSPQDIWARHQKDYDNAYQYSSFACGQNRFQNSWNDPLADQDADVCWVCQDLSTQLYLRVGYDFEVLMEASGLFDNKDDWPNPSAVSRQVVAIRTYLERIGIEIKPGNAENYGYHVGEIAFLRGSDGIEFHSGIVLRGYPGGDLDSALDRVLIAQVSYSAQGFYYSSYDPQVRHFAPQYTLGRFEVITLRTFLYKTLDAMSIPIPTTATEMSTLLGKYVAHANPLGSQ